MNLHERIRELLDDIPEERRRVLRSVSPAENADPGRVRLNGKSVVDFASNDYLGLSQHPELIARANNWAQEFGAGAKSSRLVCGNHECLDQLEEKLARMKGSESALIMGGGFQANSSVIAALMDQKLESKEASIRLFADRLCHSSFHFGVATTSVRQHRFRHNDLSHLQQLLEKKSRPGDLKLIATESLFSMDGDTLDVPAIRRLARKHDALLYVDEAHATGLYGETGMGLMSGEMHRDDIVIGTFGKALGSFGSYVACSRTIRDYLINRCSGLIYSTGLPPMLLGAIDWALDSLPNMQSERDHLRRLSQRLRDGLQKMNVDTLRSTSHIVPAVVANDSRAMDLASQLLSDGFLVGAIRPPTVPLGTTRLRISLSAVHTESQVDGLLDSLHHHGIFDERKDGVQLKAAP